MNAVTRAEVEAWSTLGPMSAVTPRVLALLDELESLRGVNTDLIERHEVMRLRAEKAEREVADLRVCSPREVSLEEQRTWELMRDVLRQVLVSPEEFRPMVRIARELVVTFDESYRAVSAPAASAPASLTFELEPLSDDGDLYTLEVFRERVADGSFIDDDGFGEYATETHCIHLQVDLSDITPPDPRFTHVVWFNK